MCINWLLCLTHAVEKRDSVKSKLYLVIITNTFFMFSPLRNVECLNLLLSSGADMNKKDKFGRFESSRFVEINEMLKVKENVSFY